MNRDIALGIKLLALDVDGVLTDGRITYSSGGEELKSFNIRDGLGIKLLQKAGINVAIITGRNSAIVQRRAAELGIEQVIQGREDKRTALLELCQSIGVTPMDCAYMGDDLPDLGAILIAGLGLTTADANAAVAESADWQSNLAGGQGAVREAAEALLKAREQLLDLQAEFR